MPQNKIYFKNIYLNLLKFIYFGHQIVKCKENYCYKENMLDSWPLN